MIKEKLIFWVLLLFFLSGIGIGISTRAGKKDVVEELMKDIESAQAKVRKVSRLKYKSEMDIFTQSLGREMFEGLIKKGPFFRTLPEGIPKKIVEEARPVIEEEPPRVKFIYKGKVQMGALQTVIIENQITGKSFFVQNGDMAGEYTVEIIKNKIILRKEGAEDIVLEAKEERQ